MAFRVSFPTRHTDTYADSGFVHAGVLLALTELAYAAFETHCGVEKPDGVLAVPREMTVTYHRPLPWQEGCAVEVETVEAGAQGFSQDFALSSDTTDVRVATLRHDWVWLDLAAGRAVPIPESVQAKYLAG
jgi:acyl-CoA thioesterase FadM